LVIRAHRWRILAAAQGDHLRLGFLVRSCLVGEFFNQFLPTGFGGDVVRIWDGSRASRSIVKSSAIVLVERLTGILMLFLFALVAALLRLDMVKSVPVVGAALVVGAAGLLAGALFFTPPVGRWLLRGGRRGLPGRLIEKAAAFRGAVLSFRRTPGPFWRALGWAVLLQLNVVLYFILIGRALGLRIPVLDYFIFVPLVILIQIIPVTINGLGLREGAYIEVFKFYGIAREAALSFSLVGLGFMLIIGAVGGILYATRK
jgi:hypothetical protein